jgi:hypothetical protein
LTLFALAPILLTFEFTYAIHPLPAYDFHALWQAGRSVLDGRNPYPSVANISSIPTVAHQEFIYPAPVAVLMVPLGALPFQVAAGILTVILMGSVALALYLLGVRDWRCYGVAYACIPVLQSFRLGAITPLLLLGVAGAWRARNRPWPLAVLVCALVVAKLFLWPLYVWLLVTRRRSAAIRSAGLACIAAAIGWWIVGFGTLGQYPALLRRMTDVQYRKSFAFEALLSAIGSSPTFARLSVLVLTACGVVAVVAAARLSGRGDVAFAVAVIVSIFASPLVWIHYYCLLLVPIALFHRRLSPLWVVPVLFWVAPYPESRGSVWRLAVVFALAVGSLAGAVPVGRWLRRVVISVRPVGRRAAAADSGA